MTEANTEKIDRWASAFLEYRKQLESLAARNLNPVLNRRISVEDLVQETLENACRRIDFFEANPEIPVYFKLRTILLQTITGCERKHLQSQKRDVYKEVDPESFENQEKSAAQAGWDQFAETVTSPLSKAARADRYELLQNVFRTLPENDRQILTLRHFDDLSNQECAVILKIEPKAASIRYVRALRKLQQKLLEFTEFHV